jgi:5'-methylthioadenosine phosphorylase
MYQEKETMSTTVKTQLGVIGGSGIYQMDGVEVVKEHDIDTPFGKPSDKVTEAVIDGRTVYFIPRHGKGHRLLPQEVPYRANIYALKSLGVTHLLAVSAVGIMKEEIKPGDFVVPDQVFDRTKGMRDSTFFGNGCAGHITFADPFCSEMRELAISAAKTKGATVHESGAYICMEGPQFSTRAESIFYRETVSPAVIGMTAVPEVKLAREAEMSYAVIATATDYDCWNESEEDVSVEAVIAVLKANAEMANSIVKEVTSSLPETSSAEVFEAAKFAVMTPKEMIPEKTKQNLELLYGKYWK